MFVCHSEAVVKNCKLSTSSEAHGCKKHFVVKFKGLEPKLPAAPFKRCAVAGSLGFFSNRICSR